MDQDHTLDDVRTAARAFAAITSAFILVSAGLIGVHGFTGMHEAAAVEPAASPAASTGPAEGATGGASAATPTTASPTTIQPAGPVTVQVTMDEFLYRPRRIQVPVGVPVTFEVVNDGQVDHELVIGDEHVQEEAEKAMAASGGHGDDHGGGHAHQGDVPTLYLEPGETGTIEATFDEPGTLLVGCHVPGHWAAGMKGFLDIVAPS